MLPVLSTWQMALSISSPQSLCYQQVSAPFSRLWKSCLATERLPWGFVLSPRVLLCFVSLWMETIQCCFWHSLSFCLCFLLLCAPFFWDFLLPACLGGAQKETQAGPGGTWADGAKTETVLVAVYSCQSYIAPSQILQTGKICLPHVGKRDFHRLWTLVSY